MYVELASKNIIGATLSPILVEIEMGAAMLLSPVKESLYILLSLSL
jgi:hypothetical protein